MNQLWQLCLAKLKELLDDDIVAYETFYAPTKLKSFEHGQATLITDLDFNRTILNTNQDQIMAIISDVFNEPCLSLQIYTQEELDAMYKRSDAPSGKNLKIENNLKPDFTFSNFVVGNSNKLAHAASLAVALSPGKNYNPLFIYGNSGLGKTHLLNAIGNYVLSKKPDTKILYISTVDFVDEYVNAIKKNMMDEFNEKYQAIELLLVDDIQFLQGKEKSHDVFFQNFNRMITKSRQIVITSDRMPDEIAGIEQRLVSRFNSGLKVGVDSPELETALAIIKKKLETFSSDFEHIDEDVLIYMANNFSGNVRELEGAINRIIFYSIATNATRINMNVALEAFRDERTSKPTVGQLTADKIKKTVAEYYNLTVTQLVGKNRMQSITTARHIAMYLMRELINLSYVKIGDEFGGRDHSTIMSACDKVEKKLQTNEEYKEAIHSLKDKLK